MDNVREITFWKIERTNIPIMETDGRMVRQVRNFRLKCFLVSRQNEGRGVQSKYIVCPGKALQEPAAEKPCTASYEYLLRTQLFPQAFSMGEDVIQVCRKGILNAII